jgi:hypothetical protein
MTSLTANHKQAKGIRLAIRKERNIFSEGENDVID